MGKDPKRKLTPYNKCMSRELKGKMSGKTKAQRAAMFKAAAKRCSKNPTGKASTSKPKNKAKSTPAGGTRKVGKSGFNMGKIKSLIRLGASLVPTAVIVFDPNLDAMSKGKRWVTWHTGWRIDEQRFDWVQLMNGYGPRIGAEIGTRADTIIRKLIRMIG